MILKVEVDVWDSKTGIFIGLTTVDILNYVDRSLAPDEKCEASLQLTLAGGPAANASIAFSYFGNSARLISHLGNHALAAIALDDLQNHQIEFQDLASGEKYCPSLSTAIINTATGDRSVVYKKQPFSLPKNQTPLDIELQDCDILLSDGHLVDVSLGLMQKAMELKIPVVVDFGSWRDNLEELFPYIDVAICSNDFVPPGCDDEKDVLQFLQKQGIQQAAVSRGDKSIFTIEEKNYVEIPVKNVIPKDTLGAGDILHGCFCHYYLHQDFLESLEMAALQATESVKHHGTRAWMKDM